MIEQQPQEQGWRERDYFKILVGLIADVWTELGFESRAFNEPLEIGGMLLPHGYKGLMLTLIDNYITKLRPEDSKELTKFRNFLYDYEDNYNEELSEGFEDLLPYHTRFRSILDKYDIDTGMMRRSSIDNTIKQNA